MKHALVPLLLLAWAIRGQAQSLHAQFAHAPADSSGRAIARAPDPWLSKDKMDHVTASAFLTGAQYYLVRQELELSHEQSLRAAMAGALVLGIAKEIYDGVSKRGTPSIKDLLADALGIGLAALLISR